MFADNWARPSRGNRFYKIRSKADGGRHRRLRPAAGLPQQRPPGHHVRRRGAAADAALRREARHARRHRHGEPLRLRGGARSARRGIAGRRRCRLSTPPPTALPAEAARARGVRIIPGATLCRQPWAASACPRWRLRASPARAQAARDRRMDRLRSPLMSVGFSPSLNLASHAGAKVVFDPATNMHRATDLPGGISLAGAAAGVWSQADAVGRQPACGRGGCGACARAPRGAPHRRRRRPVGRRSTTPIRSSAPKATTSSTSTRTFSQGHRQHGEGRLRRHPAGEALFDRRASGPSQGRHANLNTIRIVAPRDRQVDRSPIGTTTYRPPLVPEKFAALAGRGFEPVRHTAMHHRHVESGAQMMLAGLWMRPAYYGPKGDAARAIEREVRAVRESVGMIDVSTLGGLDIRGPDAAEFIERMYTWAYEKQQVGRARYALMTDRDRRRHRRRRRLRACTSATSTSRRRPAPSIRSTAR